MKFQVKLRMQRRCFVIWGRSVCVHLSTKAGKTLALPFSSNVYGRISAEIVLFFRTRRWLCLSLLRMIRHEISLGCVWADDISPPSWSVSGLLKPAAQTLIQFHYHTNGGWRSAYSYEHVRRKISEVFFSGKRSKFYWEVMGNARISIPAINLKTHSTHLFKLIPKEIAFSLYIYYSICGAFSIVELAFQDNSGQVMYRFLTLCMWEIAGSLSSYKVRMNWMYSW